MLSSVPPFDRAIALACTMATLRGQWLHVRCGCAHLSTLPVRLLLAEGHAAAGQPLADLLVRLRCKACGVRPASVHLTETALPPDVKGDVVPGWCLLLHGTETAASVWSRSIVGTRSDWLSWSTPGGSKA